MKIIQDNLLELQEKKYAEFQARLIPTIEKKHIIGVRTPKLKKFAKALINKPYKEKFLNELPHKYFDENQLHAFMLNEEKDFDVCIEKVNIFLSYIDNWATCDQLSPKCFKNNKKELLKSINKWIKSKKCYTVRFAIKCLMQYFLDENFDRKYLRLVADISFRACTTHSYEGARTNQLCRSRELCERQKRANSGTEKISIDIDSDKYYVEMMRAWYFATALAKQYKEAFKYIKGKKLNVWTHNKAIQKACESYRVSESHKKELRQHILK